MEINVKVINNAKQNKIVKINDLYRVYLTSQPIKGKANKELIKLLADYFSTKKSYITIVKGERIKNKRIKIDNLYKLRTCNKAQINNKDYRDREKNYISKVHCWER